MSYQLFATTPKGLELLLVDELRELGATDAKEKLAGVSFSGDLMLAYKACLWSRFANRVLLQLTSLPAASPEELYQAVQTINWDEHLDVRATLAVHFITSNSKITHTLYGAQKVKDAIVDQMREKHGERPNIAKHEPDVGVYVYLNRDVASISIDLSGESLHKRGYRQSAGAAPLKENLAAAILQRASWKTIANDAGSLMDPMCGSGTILIEAAFMAADIAPGINREYFGFLGWKQHQPKMWRELLNEAMSKRENGLANIPNIVGYDEDPFAIKSAFENIERAGLRGKIHVERRDLGEFVPKAAAKPGLVITNPPYGERLGDIARVKPLYTELGNRLKQEFLGWKAAVITSNPDLGKQMGLRSYKNYALFNGALPSQLLLFDVAEQYFVDRSPEAENKRRIRDAKKATEQQSANAFEMFVNRLKKNYKHKSKQARRAGDTSYLVYEADLPDYPFSIMMEGEKLIVREYEAPKKIHQKKVEARRNHVLAVLPEIIDVDPAKIYFEIVPRD